MKPDQLFTYLSKAAQFRPKIAVAKILISGAPVETGKE